MKKSTDTTSTSTYSSSYREEWEKRRKLEKEKEIEEQKRVLREMEEEKKGKITKFLKEYPPSRIEAELNEYIIDQPNLTKAVSDFLYYQALRYKFPDLPSRPLLICGPSGSGKTEVWRVAKKLYSNVFHISVANSSVITSDGWAGNVKVSSFLTPTSSNSILVFDEFDKLASPKYSIGNVNISADIQSEFLKVIEDNEYIVKGKSNVEYIIKNLGCAFCGAFESIREEKTQTVSQSIGFGSQPPEQPKYHGINRADLVEFGVLPELLGRIAVIVNTHPISEEQCLKIVRNSKSRLTVISDLLAENGIDAWKGLSDEVIVEMIKRADIGKFGFRSVLSKIETIMLQNIHENGLAIPPADENEIVDEPDNEIPRI